MNESASRPLSAQQRAVLEGGATDPPFVGPYVDQKAKGSYQCAKCGTELFRSDAKYDSGTGWPSFTEPANREQVVLREDTSHGMRRTEVVCKTCGGHLGHVFPDGPGPTCERFCMNGSALQFQEEDKT